MVGQGATVLGPESRPLRVAALETTNRAGWTGGGSERVLLALRPSGLEVGDVANRDGPYVCPTCGKMWSKNLAVMLDGDCPACNAEYGAVEQS